MILSFLITLGIVAFPFLVTLLVFKITKIHPFEHSYDTEMVAIVTLFGSSMFELVFGIIWAIAYAITKG